MPNIIPLDDHSFAIGNPLVKRAIDYEQAAMASSTVRSYRSFWNGFVAWCKSQGICALPCSSEAICLYLSHIAPAVAISTISSVIAAIEYAHKHSGVEIIGDKDRYRNVRKGIKRTHTEKLIQKKAKALSTLDLAMLGKLEASTLIDIRDRAIIFLCFFAALRRSELVSLDIEHVAITSQGAEITLLQSKTSCAPTHIAVGRTHNPDICPVRALERWIEAAEIKSGALFLALTPTGRIYNRRLSAQVVRLIMSKRFGKEYSGHSGRRGLITEEARRGISPYQIAKHSRHRDFNVLIGYVEQEQAFETSSSKLLGV